jgi:hypothetical protein
MAKDLVYVIESVVVQNPRLLDTRYTPALSDK